MSHQTLMYVRMLALACLPLVASIGLAFALSSVVHTLRPLASLDVATRLPELALLVGASLTLIGLAWQIYRLRGWELGRTSLICQQCGCLLGHLRDGRWGTYRRCLGCSHNQSTTSMAKQGWG